MPLDHGCRLYQHHRVEDLRPNPVKPNPEKSVRGEEPNPTWALSPQDTHLMSQRDELEFQGGAATKPEAEYGNDGGKNRDHARDGRAGAQKSPAFLGPFGVLSKHRRQFKAVIILSVTSESDPNPTGRRVAAPRLLQ